jgi:hypothetical protein
VHIVFDILAIILHRPSNSSAMESTKIAEQEGDQNLLYSKYNL